MQPGFSKRRHPGIEIKNIGYAPFANSRSQKPSHRRNSVHKTRQYRNQKQSSTFKNQKNQLNTTMPGYQGPKSRKENKHRTTNSKNHKKNHIQFDSKGFGRSLRNSYYLMHHKQMFYQTLMKDNDNFEKTYQKTVEDTHSQMDQIYRGGRAKEADLYRRGLGESSQSKAPQIRSKSNARPPQMSLNIINSEIKNFARKKPPGGCKFKRELDEKMLVKAVRNNEMVSNITAGILRKEIEKNLRELKKTHDKLVEVEQGKEFPKAPETSPKTTIETEQDQLTSSKLMKLNRELQRPPKRIHQEHEVLLLDKDARPRAAEWVNPQIQENDYLEEVLNKRRKIEMAPSSQETNLGGQNRFFLGQEKKRETLSINQKIQNKTLIRGVLGSVGKSHMAEDYYNGRQSAYKRDPKTMADELYDTIKLKSKFATREQNRQEGFALPVESQLGPINNVETLKASLKFEKWPRTQIGNSHNLNRTRNNVQQYLTDVLSGRKDLDVYADAPVENEPPTGDVFGYLETLKNTFDLKNSLGQSRPKAGLTGKIFQYSRTN